MIRKISPLIIAFALALTSIFPSTPAAAVSGSDWRAGRIIDDSIFFNENSMSVSQIQNFLNAKVPTCDNWGTQSYAGTTRREYSEARGIKFPLRCLKEYYENPTTHANNLEGRSRPSGSISAAQIIWNASQNHNINPQSLIVLLQKEQALVTDDWPWPIQFRSATGYGCPDTADCDDDYYGFYNQVESAAWQFRRYADQPNDYNHVAGQNNSVRYNPSSSCGSSTVFIQNQATAGLYNYTPYQPNQAALDNLYGTGNACSAYGNRNFWRLFNDWFGSTVGTPLFRIGSGDAVYILGANNTYYHIASQEVLWAYGFGTLINKIESRPSSYLSGKTNAGNLPLDVRFEGSEVYMMDSGNLHHFTSSGMMSTYGFTLGQEAKLPSPYKQYYLPSSDMQQILRHTSGPEVYSVESGKKRHIVDSEAYSTLGSPVYSSRSSVTLNTNTASTISDGAPIMAGNKLLRRSDNNTFSFWDGTDIQDVKRETVAELNMNIDYEADSTIINQLPSGGALINKYVKNAGGQLYLLDNRQKFLVSSGDLSEMGLTSDSFTLASDGFLNLAGPSRNFVRVFRINNSREIYLVDNGQRHHFTSVLAINERGFSSSQIINLNSTSSALFPYSGKKILASGTLFRIGSTAPVYIVNSQSSSLHVPAAALLSDYGKSIDNTLGLTNTGASGYPSSGSLSNFMKDGSNNVWLIANNLKRLISSDMQNSSKYNINTSSLEVASNWLLNSLSQGSDLTEVIQAVGDNKVYKIENGGKRWITTSTKFFALGYTTSDITKVSLYFLNTLPAGANIN